MALTREELEAAKTYMRVEGHEGDLAVTACVEAARTYLSQAGVSLPGGDDLRRNLYDLVCHAMALDAYDHRGTELETTVTENPAIRRMLNQLKLTEPPASSSDAGAGEG